MHALRHFPEIWCADFEFRQSEGELPEPLCLVARELRSGELLRLWQDELATLEMPPFPTGDGSLFVAYYASAELGCFLSLGWSMPTRILDLFAEFRCLTNGVQIACGNSLLGALAHFGLGGVDAAEKDSMRKLAMFAGPHTEAEISALLDYCQTDVDALTRLLPAMLPMINLPRALLRGRYMAAAAKMERLGIPTDTETLARLRHQWGAIKGRLTREIDTAYGCYIPTGVKFNPQSRFGSAVLDGAKRWGIEPHRLAQAATFALAEAEQQTGDFRGAVKAAREATGLALSRISKWEDSGKDYSTWPGLDTQARDLAGEYPELGIGPGYVTGDNFDDTDYAGKLWELLRYPHDAPFHNYDEEILRSAAHLADGLPEDGPLSFSAEMFAGWLIRQGIPWPQLESGALALDDDTFRQMARAYPAVAPLRELRHTLGEMRLFSDLAVGHDNRNRCLLSAYRSITGRNQPSSAKFLFGPSCWLRGLIRPEPGRAVAYVDWSQQEFGIAAALSGDGAMIDAYASGDPYLAFAKQAGIVPSDATKQSHPAERERCKVCILATQYGMGSKSLALSLAQPEALARELLALHRTTYPRFWRWSQAAVDHAMLRGWLQTVFGWRVTIGGKANPRSLANFPMQANGAEMLRLACCLATERGIQVCAPIHDALLVEGEADEIESVVNGTQEAMKEASRVVLDGFELRSDAKIVRHPDRYMDPRGHRMWETVMRILESVRHVGVVGADDDF